MKLVEAFEEAVRDHEKITWEPSIPEHQAVEQAYQRARQALEAQVASLQDQVATCRELREYDRKLIEALKRKDQT